MLRFFLLALLLTPIVNLLHQVEKQKVSLIFDPSLWNLNLHGLIIVALNLVNLQKEKGEGEEKLA